MMNATNLTVDSSTMNALKHAISYHNEATAIMSTGQHDTTRQAKATSALTKVLRTCQAIISNLDDGHSVQSSSGKIVQALLERCMNNQDLHDSEVIPRCRSITTSSMMTNNYRGDDDGTAAATTSSGPPQIGSRNRGSTLPPQHQTGREHSASISNHEDDCGFLYSKPIRIPPTVCDSHVMSTCGISNICMFLSCTATFNLALIHQVLAQDQSTEELRKRSKGLLTKATRLYEICLTLSSEETNQQQDQESQYREASIFELATTNNLGMALEQLNESEKAQQYFTLALSTLMCLICQTTAPGRASIIGQTILPCSSDIDGFFRTASRIMSYEKAAPAA